MLFATRRRTAVVLLTFATAAAAGWFTASPPMDEISPRIPALTKQAAAPVAVAYAPSAKTPFAVIAALEREFALSLDPAAETYTGESLMELCRGDHPSDLPGGNEAFGYARRWATKDPQGMFEWFLGQGRFTLPTANNDTSYSFLTSVFNEWAKQDAGAAVAAALRCPGKREQGEAMTAIVESLIKTDASRARAVAAGHMQVISAERPRNFSAYGKDFAEKWTFLCGLPAGKDRARILASYFNDVTRYHLSDSGRLWHEAPEEIRRELAAGGFAAGQIESDDIAAGKAPAFEGLADLLREQAEAGGDSLTARRFLNARGKEWAQNDPAAAVAWSLAHLKGEERVTLTTQLFTDAAAHDFDAAVRTWQTLPDGILRARAAGRIAAAAADARAEDVKALLAALPAGDQAIALAERKQAPAKLHVIRQH